ncbi:hypothetical protein KUTeg_014207 [Tegillarca granosa]|uniref:EF-hand domain-containing protein n=1 Tax=Tegillarca granosa TaxID=220873 RepID=A0ABQ9EVZ7_TEGGR|nr:hypothetical protein KUTeg_014207 [Tegillarca granosa]
MFDKDGSGSISAEELGHIMKALGQNPSRQELDEAIASVDSDGSGEIDFDEFVEMMAKRLKEIDPVNEINDAFKVFDSDEVGYLMADELRHILKTFGDEPIAEEDIEEMVKHAVGDDPDDTIHYKGMFR